MCLYPIYLFLELKAIYWSTKHECRNRVSQFNPVDIFDTNFVRFNQKWI